MAARDMLYAIKITDKRTAQHLETSCRVSDQTGWPRTHPRRAERVRFAAARLLRSKLSRSPMRRSSGAIAPDRCRTPSGTVPSLCSTSSRMHRFVLFRQLLIAQVEAGDQQHPRRAGVYGNQQQVRANSSQAADDFPDVAGPDARPTITVGLPRMNREDVVEHD